MNFLNRLERKFGKYAISNLSFYLIVAYGIGYVMSLSASFGGLDLLSFVTLNPYLITKGQVWRVISWILVPPSNINLFTIIMLYFYYSIGSTLERTWGVFRYNLYIFSGMLFTLVGAFILYFVYLGLAGSGGHLEGSEAQIIGLTISMAFSTYYINLSIFLAFAAVYPNVQVLLFFVIPVKMKYLAYVDVAMLLYSFFANGGMAPKVAIIMSLLNFIVFFFGTRDYRRINPKEIHRRNEYKRQTQKMQSPSLSKHKCAICGRTEKDGDELEFRFCSKCNGNYEYCQDHLFTHEHIH